MLIKLQLEQNNYKWKARYAAKLKKTEKKLLMYEIGQTPVFKRTLTL